MRQRYGARSSARAIQVSAHLDLYDSDSNVVWNMEFGVPRNI